MKLKDLTLKNIRYFLEGYYFLFLEKLNWLTLLFKHRKEQYEFRKIRVLKISPNCIKDKKCVHCTCNTPALFLAKKGCELGCYPELMSKKEWDLSNEKIEYNNTKNIYL